MTINQNLEHANVILRLIINTFILKSQGVLQVGIG